jgi:hypothetical protein
VKALGIAKRTRAADDCDPDALWVRFASMTICQAHNLRAPVIDVPRPYGVRISLAASDPFRNLLGADWHRVHWFADAASRDAALTELSRKHEYSRPGDRPALVYERISR